MYSKELFALIAECQARNRQGADEVERGRLRCVPEMCQSCPDAGNAARKQSGAFRHTSV